ncbi:Dynamin family protein [Salinibacillus kushneri]|uniref:Dynamin family protein n=1 Tax=Salinibacillus kushneri TaxID=237682 RepID=A0A1I0DKE7_9BACI|nr:dynamin family protein [Salinibacillus kushneri]SET32950.1 Dynamin family protein [Salinibacillus kushneri]
MTTYTNKTSDKKLKTLATLYEQLDEYGDKKRIKKLLDLYKKYQDKEMIIGFSGHFSAGKSSMINRLISDDLLPSSPIPTSANLVKIKNANPYTKVFFRKDAPVHYSSLLDMDVIKSLCRDGDTIQQIEIGKPINELKQNVSILDTPGIDSSDDADRMMTESSIHLVDVWFYIMDYNHVQSEVNLGFLKNLQSRGKPFYIVVNQIDKHQDEELSFMDFKNSVDKALKQWDIKPEAVYYTSLKNENHPLNQLHEMRELVQSITSGTEGLIEDTINHSAFSLIKDHIEYVKGQYNQELVDLQRRLDEFKENGYSEQLEKEIDESTPFHQEAENLLKKKLRDLFKNAYLMPYENREKAKSFLEAMQPNFKIGLLMARKKTEAERRERHETFYQSLMETAEVQLTSHIRDVLLEIARTYHVSDEEILQDVQSFTISYDFNRVKDLIKQGAEVTGDYVLVYTNDVTADLTSCTKDQVLSIWEKMKSMIQKWESDQIKAKQDQLEQQKEYNSIKEQIQQIHRTIEERSHRLKEIFNGKVISSESHIYKIEKVLHNMEEGVQYEKTVSDDIVNRKVFKEEDSPHHNQDSISHPPSVPVEDMIQRLGKTKNVIHDMTGFQNLYKELALKQERMKNRHFTIALFGAFSAGKSSFANALLGNEVLPVSPHPTTATINKISPPNDEYQHGMVVVKIKNEHHLLEDIKHAGKHIPNHFTKLSEAMYWLESVDINQFVEENEKKNLSFLQALQKGYQEMGPYLDDQLTTQIQNASSYIADETYACFVEWVEFYYDCKFTQNGITLVDTPGADSVNARHTDVAFEYIKDSDAILFVTYYNHAFSRTDREFLIQLGRVKDVFSLDKMFFIINAKDLADSDGELGLVQSYVTEQLSNFGIHNPRMYPVSSKWALKEKQVNQQADLSGLADFEQDFTTFIQDELTGMMIFSALHDIKRVVSTLDEYRKRASMSIEEKQMKKDIYEKDRERILKWMNDLSFERHQKAIKQEMEELIYYINQRVFLSFSDLFKETINPATIKSNGRKGKDELQKAFIQLVDYLNEKLIREWQATELRIEAFMNNQINKINEDLQSHEQIEDYPITFQKDVFTEFESPAIQLNIRDFDWQPFEKVFATYKSTKSFFEQNKKEQMQEALQNLLKPIVKEHLNKEGHHVIQNYLNQWEQTMGNIKTSWYTTINQYFEGLFYSLTDDIDLTMLKTRYEQLKPLADI